VRDAAERRKCCAIVIISVISISNIV